MRTRSSLELMCARLDAFAKRNDVKTTDDDLPVPNESSPSTEDMSEKHQRELEIPEDEKEDMLKKEENKITTSLFVKWYTNILSTRQNTAHEINPKRVGLYMSTQAYRVDKLTEFEYESGQKCPIEDIQEILLRTNVHTKACMNGKSVKTFATNNIPGEIPPLPDGLHMFDVPSDSVAEVKDEALRQINLLFQNQFKNPNHDILMYDTRPVNNVILFYDPTNLKQHKFKDVITILRNETPALAEYILIYCKQFMQLTGIDVDQLENANLTLVYYPIRAGLNPHIDSVVPFKGTMGPILTISMGSDIKMLDMLPTLEPGHVPVRIFSKPNQFTIMDGKARVTWSHGLPWNRKTEQWTVALKFPELIVAQKHTKTFVYNHNGKNITTEIPFHLQPPDVV